VDLKIKETKRTKIDNDIDSSVENFEEYAPEVPEPPKKPPIPKNSEDLSEVILEKINVVDSETIKAILMNCERCDCKIVVPVPKKPILESSATKSIVTFVHKNIENEDRHCITFEVDADFNVQLPRVSDVIFASETINLINKKLKIPDIKFVLIHCDRCYRVIHVPIPEKLVQNSTLSRIPITFIHENYEFKDPHAITLFLDKNYGDRDTRLSDLLIFE
jgi:hypothetical protein